MINIVSVSGGKDSTATLLLAIERGAENLRAVFADTGHEHDLTYEYVDYLERATGIPIRRVKADFSMRIANKREYVMTHWAKDGVPDEHIRAALDTLVVTGNPFLDLCIWKGRFPSVKGRFCTDELKVAPITERVMIPAIKKDPDVWSWQGVRADESLSRAKLPEQEKDDLGVTIYRPILSWKAEDTFAIAKRHGIEPNALYKLGMGRVGCMPCIMARKGELASISARFPEVFDKLVRWERIVSAASKRKIATFYDGRIAARLLDDDNIHHTTHGAHIMREYATTGRGGRQQDMWLQAEPPTCQSNYGLCE